MSRADKVLAQVAAGMQDYYAVREVLADSVKKSLVEGDESHIMIDIASAISEANQPGVSPAHWETVGTRLLHTLERYARAALTEAAESDIPLSEEESDE